jgi:hypothetical protein
MEFVYDVPYTPDNVDYIYKKYAIGNGNQFRNPLSRNSSGGNIVNFYIQMEQTKKLYWVNWSSQEESYRLFRDKSFSYL